MKYILLGIVDSISAYMLIYSNNLSMHIIGFFILALGNYILGSIEA